MKIILRSHHVPLSSTMRHYLSHLVESVLSRFESSIGLVRVALRDVNGPKGGEDILCRLEAVCAGSSVIIEEWCDNPFGAVTKASSRARRALSRRLGKVRSKRRRRRREPELVASRI